MVQASIKNLEQTLSMLFKEFNHAALFPNAQGYGLVAGFSNVAKSCMLSSKESLKGWRFGHLNYNLKNDFEVLESNNLESFSFANELAFMPQVLILGNTIFVDEAFENSLADWIEPQKPESRKTISSLKTTLHRQDYLSRVKALIDEIKQGNIYEVTYSIEQVGSMEIFNPVNLFFKGHARFNAPMSCLYKQDQNWLFCFSPERYLRIEDEYIISQPIKGTARRDNNAEEDDRIACSLIDSEKEVAENVMIVDLVRNDLSRIAQKDTVKVDELCGLHTFNTVHQLISTVSAKIRLDVGFSDVILATFPMGSMTGAPKISAMQLIEKHETFSRSVYSGSVFWQSPEGITDMNVVIRSILWDENRKFGAIRTGSAITVLSDPEEEYSECLLKAEALVNLLQE